MNTAGSCSGWRFYSLEKIIANAFTIPAWAYSWPIKSTGPISLHPVILLAGEAYAQENKDDSAISVMLEGLNIAERLKLEDRLPWFYLNLGESYRLIR